MVEQERRRERLRALLIRFEHDDSDSIPPVLDRFVTVERVDDDLFDSVWMSFGDEIEELLEECEEEFDDSGYEPFLLVDLDSGEEYDVEDFIVLG